METKTDISESTALENAVKNLNISSATSKPSLLPNHRVAGEFLDTGVGLFNISDQEPSFEELVTYFKIICPDYDNQLISEKKSLALSFSNQILFKIAPESMKIEKSGLDKTWKLHFPYAEEVTTTNDQGERVFTTNLSIKVAYITTKAKANKIEPNSITLTVRNASLLALNVLMKTIPFGLARTPPIKVMTSISLAVYSKYDVEVIASLLKIEPVQVLERINTSCQPGGHCLKYSDINCALASIVAIAAKIENANDSSRIIERTKLEYYMTKGMYDVGEIKIWMKFAAGGLPTGLADCHFNETPEQMAMQVRGRNE